MRDAASYSIVAVGLHWLLAVAIAGALGVGFYMHGLPFSPLRLRLFNWHKWAGVTILVLSAARLLWRLGHTPPPLPPDVLADMPAWHRRARHLTHALLYLLFFAVPLSGWAYSSGSGFPVVWFGVVPLPDWVAVDKPFAASFLKPVHQTLAFTLAALVTCHVAAALKHHFLDRNALLRRMWPNRRHT